MDLNNVYPNEGSNEIVDKTIIPVFRWQGEDNCIIGPFKTELAATQFSGILDDLVDTKRSFQGHVYEQSNQWFIELDCD